jgi:hypothetical protein
LRPRNPNRDAAGLGPSPGLPRRARLAPCCALAVVRATSLRRCGMSPFCTRGVVPLSPETPRAAGHAGGRGFESRRSRPKASLRLLVVVRQRDGAGVGRRRSRLGRPERVTAGALVALLAFKVWSAIRAGASAAASPRRSAPQRRHRGRTSWGVGAVARLLKAADLEPCRSRGLVLGKAPHALQELAPRQAASPGVRVRARTRPATAGSTKIASCRRTRAVTSTSGAGGRLWSRTP